MFLTYDIDLLSTRFNSPSIESVLKRILLNAYSKPSKIGNIDFQKTSLFVINLGHNGFRELDLSKQIHVLCVFRKRLPDTFLLHTKTYV